HIGEGLSPVLPVCLPMGRRILHDTGDVFPSSGRTVPLRRLSVALEIGTRAAFWPGGFRSHTSVRVWPVVVVHQHSGLWCRDLGGAPPLLRRFTVGALDFASCQPCKKRCSLGPAGGADFRERRTVL